MEKQKSYLIIACKLLSRELDHYASISPHNFEFQYLSQDLHNIPETLNTSIQKAIDNVTGNYDGILLGYGLCSNALNNITASSNIPLILIKAHDCITFLLGSKDKYKEHFNNNPGTYWYSKGWIETGTQPGKERYEKLLSEYTEKYGDDNAKYLMEMEQDWFYKYNSATFIESELDNTESAEDKDYTKESAKYLKWDYKEIKGNPNLIKNFLLGNWNKEDYFIVEANKTVIASNTNEIFKIKED